MKIIGFIALVVIIIIIAVHLSSDNSSSSCPGQSACSSPYLGPGTGPEMPKIHNIVDAP
jgi:hypothetical protein